MKMEILKRKKLKKKKIICKKKCQKTPCFNFCDWIVIMIWDCVVTMETQVLGPGAEKNKL